MKLTNVIAVTMRLYKHRHLEQPTKNGNSSLKNRSYLDLSVRNSLLPSSCAKIRFFFLVMEKSARFALALVTISMLISYHPIEAWYKQTTGPSYYSVGRASGLLSGIRRSPYARRSEPESVLESESTVNSVLPELVNRQTSILKTMAICVKDIFPNLQSCELAQDGSSTFQCKADVLLSLDSQDCASA